MHGGEAPEVPIAPKGARVRVLLVGGSNVQGFPAPKLEAALGLALPEPGVEVVNLGRRGYGSGRCRILLEQALDALQPDVVVIYSGHNEFVELGFAQELDARWRSAWLARAAEGLSGLRSVNALAALLRRRARTEAAAVGAEVEPLREETALGKAGLTYADTQRAYDAYADNLRAMCDASRARGVRVVLCTVVANMVFPPSRSGAAGGPGARPDETLYRLERDAVALLPERFRRHVVPIGGAAAGKPELRLRSADWGDRPDDESPSGARPLGPGTRSLPGPPPALRPLAAPFDGGPYWPEPSRWGPRVAPVLGTWSHVHAPALTVEEQRAAWQAIAGLEQSLARWPDDPWLHYERAVAALVTRDGAAAARHLDEAARLEVTPARGNVVTNGLVRRVAAERPGVRLLDVEAQVRAVCPDGITGYELMKDHCHFHEKALPVLMRAFVGPIVEQAREALASRAAR